MTFTATFNNPAYNLSGGGSGVSEAVDLSMFALSGDYNVISAGVFFIPTDVKSKYSLETVDTNAVQQNGTIVFKRDSDPWFRGYVIKKPVFTEYPTGTIMQVACWGVDGVLAQTIVPDANGNDVWHLATSDETVTDLPLKKSSNYGTFQGDSLWPDPLDPGSVGQKCYIQDSDSNSDALDVAIGVGTYAIDEADQTNKYFYVQDNVPDEFVAGETFDVSGSDGGDNDGGYTIIAAVWLGPGDTRTRITVSEPITTNEGAGAGTGNIDQSNILLSETAYGFRPRGWVKIESEWIYYDGYHDSSGADDNKYRLRNCKRGELGTTKVAHVATTAVYEKIGKRIAPGSITLQNDPTTGYVSLRLDKEYVVHVEIGAFVLPATASGTYRATYDIYDEDKVLNGASTVVTVNDVVEAMLTAPRRYGGPGFETWSITEVHQGNKTFTIAEDGSNSFTVGDFAAVYNSTGNDGVYTITNKSGSGPTVITVSEAVPSAVVDGKLSPDLWFDATTNALKITRYDYDPEEKPEYTWDAIRDFLRVIDLEDEVKFWYRHDKGKFRLRIVANDTAAFKITTMTGIEEDVGIEDTMSGIRIRYTDDQNLNRVSAEYSWHQEATGVGAKPDIYKRISEDGASWEFPDDHLTTDTAEGDFGMDMVVDGRPDTKLGAFYDYDPAGSIEFGQFWFGPGTTPPAINLDQINLKIGSYREIDADQPHRNSTNTWVVHLEGCDDYSTATHSGTWVNLGVEFEGFPDKNGKWVQSGNATAFKKRTVNAVRIMFDYMPGPDTITGSELHSAVIHDLEIQGSNVQYVLVQLSALTTDAGDATKLIASGSFEKMRGGIKSGNGIPGCPRILSYPIGAASDAAAVSLGRVLLIDKLRLHTMRKYRYEGVLPAKPEVGLTLEVDENGNGEVDYTGVLWSWGIVADGNGIVTTGSVLDMSASVIT